MSNGQAVLYAVPADMIETIDDFLKEHDFFIHVGKLEGHMLRAALRQGDHLG